MNNVAVQPSGRQLSVRHVRRSAGAVQLRGLDCETEHVRSVGVEPRPVCPECCQSFPDYSPLFVVHVGSLHAGIEELRVVDGFGLQDEGPQPGGQRLEDLLVGQGPTYDHRTVQPEGPGHRELPELLQFLTVRS